MILFDDMVEKIIFQVDYEGEAEDFAWVIPVPGYPYLFSVDEMDDDLILVPVPKHVMLGNIIDLNSPIGQFALIIGIFILFAKIKSRLFL